MNKILYIAFLLLLAQYGSAQCLYTDICPTDTVEVCDLSPNDAGLWNETYWLDPVTSLHDLPDASVSLSFTATDSCQGANLSFHFHLELDLDGNGIPESLLESNDLPMFGAVPFGNINGPTEVRIFDQRPVPANEKYAFALEISGTDTTKTARVRWNTAQNPGTYIDPQLPYGTHRITWTVTDGLGNSSACTYLFEIKDCKKPTVVCLNGLSVNIMPTGLISLWASDFIQYSEDNHTPTNQLQYAVIKSSESVGVFPTDTSGAPQTMVLFDCTELGQQLVQLWSRDLYGNTEFCETIVLIQDPFGNCDPQPYSFAVCLQHWCDGAPFSGAADIFLDFNPAVPPFFLSDSLSLENGCIYFRGYGNGIPLDSAFTILPNYNADALNGVSVLDMLRIAQHILGVEPLPSPFAMIAADINRSNSITTFDIVELRKVLVGTYLEFPINDSWRFIDADFIFPNPLNPFSGSFPEFRNANFQPDSLFSYSFNAVKIGDVDCSAMPGLTAMPEDRRMTGLLLPDRTLQAGETADLPLRFDQDGRCLGFQFGLEFDPEALEIVSVSAPGLPEWEEDNWAVPAPGRLNIVWASLQGASGPEILTVRVKAREQVRLSDVLELAETGLPALLCDDQMNTSGLHLSFRDSRLDNQPASAIGAARPNPTAAGFSVPVRLEEPGPVTLRLYNALGMLVYELREVLPAGAYELEVPAERMQATGLYWYELRAGRDTAVGTVARSVR